MIKRVVIYLIVLILISTFVSASFEVGNLSHSLTYTSYNPGSSIEGWINISLDNELVNSIFKDSENNSISLISLLEKNQNFDYSCTPTDCEPDYSASNGELTKTFNTNIGESIIAGIKLTGKINSINSINLTLQSDALSSCSNQISIDFLLDGTDEVKNYKSLNVSCPSLRTYGCFNDAVPNEEYIIGGEPYCQRIKLSKSPGFKLGGWIKEEVAGNNKLIMELYDIDKNKFVNGANCELPTEKISGAGDISCDITYLVGESKDYYVCIYDEGGSGTYKIKGYDTGAEICGFLGTPIQTETNSYKIFSEGKKFASVGTLKITNLLPNGDNLKDLIENYLIKKYGLEMNCPLNGCIIPLIIRSEKNQKIILNNLKLEYRKVGSIAVTDKFYDLTRIPATVSSPSFQKLYLDNGNFSLPSKEGPFIFTLKFNGEGIFSENVSIQLPVIKSLTPTSTASTYPTQFKIITNSPRKIVSYKWDFGDNYSEVTPTDRVTHTYTHTGSYQLKIEVIDSNQKSSYKIFNILVSSPEEIINSSLKKMQEDLTHVSSQLKDFSEFQEKSLSSALGIDELNSELKRLQREYATDKSEEGLNKIMSDLLTMTIPESIRVGKNANLISFYPSKNNIDLEILKSIGGGNESIRDKNKYIETILLWNQKNIETKIDFKEFLVRYENFEEPILRTFELKISEKDDLKYTPYLILRKLDNLDFKENYLENEEDGYSYIELKQAQETITFSTTEDVDFTNLPLFISPPISRLSLTQNIIPIEEEKKTSRWISFILIIFLVLVAGTIGYGVLQEWYKRKYESYLFKNRNDLYNIISYIEITKKKGLKDYEIKKKLKKAGWNSEQINYTIRKYIGKRTGMIELPIKKIFNIFQRGGKKVPQKNKVLTRNLR